MISREEAIERLKDMRDEAQGWNNTLFTVSGKLAHSFKVDVQSLDMAIEALQERPKGRWIEIPCNIGDTVYWVTENDFDGEWGVEIMTGKVFAIGIDEGLTMWISVRYDGGLKFYHPLKDFGKELFLTKDEVEKALADMRGEEE